MNIIAIDTSTETLGICLKTDKIIIRISQRANFKHAETLAPWIEKLCIEAEIRPKDFNLIVISIGPGSFTGLRIGIATAKGLAAGAECPVTGVSGLDASAWTHKYFSGTVIPVINAKKNRIYSALYQNDKRITPYLDISSDELLQKIESQDRVLLTGPFADKIFELAKTLKNSKNIYMDTDFSLINSYSLLQKGIILYNNKGTGDKEIIPLYLRKSEAELNLGKGKR